MVGIAMPSVQAQAASTSAAATAAAAPAPYGDSLLNAKVIDTPRNYDSAVDIDAAIALPDFSVTLPEVGLPAVKPPAAPIGSAMESTVASDAEDAHHDVEEIALPDATDGFVAGPASKSDRIGTAEFARLQAEFRARLQPAEEEESVTVEEPAAVVGMPPSAKIVAVADTVVPENPPDHDEVEVPATQMDSLPTATTIVASQPDPADPEPMELTSTESAAPKIVPPTFEVPAYQPPADMEPLPAPEPPARPPVIGNSRSGYINPNPPATDADLLFDPAEQARIDTMMRSAQAAPEPKRKAGDIEVQSINVGRVVDAPDKPAVALREDSMVNPKMLDAKPAAKPEPSAKPSTPSTDMHLPDKTGTARADADAPKVSDKLAANAQKAAGERAKPEPAAPAPKKSAGKVPKALKAVALALKPAAKPKPNAAARAAAEETDATPVPANTAADAPFRILVVEDDRGQALFAQSILHGAGMQADVEMEADKVLAAIARFQPDLVLMDLHMPGRDGMSLTQDIRATPALASLPVVFLTGDPDPEKQYEVLESGADDYLTKPIRPRHLILSVSNRIRRARQNSAPTPAAPTINPETGLPTRTHVMQQLASAVKAQASAGLFFVEIAGAVELRGKYDYTNFEHLMLQVGRCLAQAASPHPVTRLGDDSFLALGNGLSGDALHAFARSLRAALEHASFTLRNDAPQPLQGVVGYAELPQSFVDAGSALEATERAALDARSQASGVSAYVADAPQDELTRLLANAELELAFQPIVATAGNDEAQYQVLLRMRRADGSLVSAAQAVPVAEQAGRIVELDRQVMESVLATLAQSQAEGNPLRLFVSQSPRSLARDDAAEWLFGALIRHRADPRQLVIDLRLGDALTNSVTLGQFCQRLMSVGVQFALSQYEPVEGASALLTQLPLSYLRLSPRYAEVHRQPKLAQELRAIVERAHPLGLQVVGQQIEEEQAMSAMWMSGVDFIQGNLVQGVGSDMGFDFHNAVL